MKILLHACCGPCSLEPVGRTKSRFLLSKGPTTLMLGRLQFSANGMMKMMRASSVVVSATVFVLRNWHAMPTITALKALAPLFR